MNLLIIVIIGVLLLSDADCQRVVIHGDQLLEQIANIGTNFDLLNQSHSEMIQTQNEMIQSLTRLIETQNAIIESVSSLQRSHDSFNASLDAMEQSNDESFARVEQRLVSTDNWQRCFNDCQDYRNHGLGHTNRIITIPNHAGACNQESYCDMETDGGGWTVFQRHQSDSVSFNRSWDDYKNGFGDLSDSFWWGNEKLAQALNDGRQYELRIDLFDWEGEHRYAQYSHFCVAPESDDYRLNISGYTGNTRADSFGSWVNGEQFSTIDRDNDRASDGNCAAYWGGGGFWYSSCGWFFPNGRYSRNSSVPVWWGLHWRDWHGSTYSLKAVSMAFRATD